MTITTRDQLISSMGNNSSSLIIDKASISGQAASTFVSLWRATGQPGPGDIPTAAASCDNTSTGALQFTQQTAPATSYLGILEGLCSNAGTTLEIHDRLAHMGGLSGIVTTAQTVGVDINALRAFDNIDARKGNANFSDIQWWLEWYAATGATNTTVNVDVTYNDGTTGTLTGTLTSTPTGRPASFLFALNNLIPAAAAGKYIRSVNNVTLTASTGTAGNFGVTATRYRAALYKPLANVRWTADWAGLGLPEISNESCLFPIQITGNVTTTGTVRAIGKIIHG